MSHKFIKDFVVGEAVTDFYMVKSKRTSKTRQGKSYLDLTLQDCAGTVGGKVWEDAEVFDGQFSRGDVIKIQADVDKWQDEVQLKIKRLRKAEESDQVNMDDLIPTTAKNIQELMEYVRGLIDGIADQDLKNLLETMFADGSFTEALESSAAARDLHQSYRGGLLEHTVNMLKIADFVCREIYPQLDRDLVITGVILHDIGKIEELNSAAEVSYTIEGYLMGHLFIGTRILDRYVRLTENFPEEKHTALTHIILSHHGEKEWGSPVVPLTPEAMLIHHLDNIDAKTNMVIHSINTDSNRDEAFTAYHKTLKRHFFKGFSYIKEPKTSAPEEDDAENP